MDDKVKFEQLSQSSVNELDQAFDFKSFLESLSNFTQRVLDHLRNYLICASIYVVGKSASNHPEWKDVGQIGELLGPAVAVLAVVLAVLNSLNVVYSIWTTLPTYRGRGEVFRFIVLSIYLAVVYVLIKVSINISISN